MKKAALLFLLCGAGIILAGCAHGKITVWGPMILGEGHTRLADGTDASIYPEMTEGQYFQEPEPAVSPYVSNFQGKYRIWVESPSATLCTAEVAFDKASVLTFSQTFCLEFGDYNGDGNPDFALGQRLVGSANMLYQLYSIGLDGEISQLSFADGRNAFAFRAAQDAFSITPESRDGRLIFPYYDTALAGLKEAVYQWENGQFVSVP